MTANGHGTDALEGLKIRVYVKEEFYDLDCKDLLPGDHPTVPPGDPSAPYGRPPFNGYILTPASAD